MDPEKAIKADANRIAIGSSKASKRAYPCPLCRKTFASPRGILVHMNMIHPEDVEKKLKPRMNYIDRALGRLQRPDLQTMVEKAMLILSEEGVSLPASIKAQKIDSALSMAMRSVIVTRMGDMVALTNTTSVMLEEFFSRLTEERIEKMTSDEYLGLIKTLQEMFSKELDYSERMLSICSHIDPAAVKLMEESMRPADIVIRDEKGNIVTQTTKLDIPRTPREREQMRQLAERFVLEAKRMRSPLKKLEEMRESLEGSSKKE